MQDDVSEKVQQYVLWAAVVTCYDHFMFIARFIPINLNRQEQKDCWPLV